VQLSDHDDEFKTHCFAEMLRKTSPPQGTDGGGSFPGHAATLTLFSWINIPPSPALLCPSGRRRLTGPVDDGN
jgi:hypothetical protein